MQEITLVIKGGFRTMAIRDVPKHGLQTDRPPARIANRALEHFDIQMLAAVCLMFFHNVKQFSRFDHTAVVLCILLGQRFRIQVEVGFSPQVVERRVHRIAKFLLPKTILPCKSLRKTLSGRLSTKE